MSDTSTREREGPLAGTTARGLRAGGGRWAGCTASSTFKALGGGRPPDVSSCCLQPEKVQWREPELGGEQRKQVGSRHRKKIGKRAGLLWEGL